MLKKAGALTKDSWVWPDGRKTNLRFIGMAVRKKHNLPYGFYKVASKSDNSAMRHLVVVAKSLGLKDNVTSP